MPLRLLTNLALLIGSAGAFMVATPSPARTAAAAAVSSTPVAPSMARVPRARPFMQDAAEDLEEAPEDAPEGAEASDEAVDAAGGADAAPPPA